MGRPERGSVPPSCCTDGGGVSAWCLTLTMVVVMIRTHSIGCQESAVGLHSGKRGSMIGLTGLISARKPQLNLPRSIQ